MPVTPANADPKSVASARILAYLIVSQFGEELPLYGMAGRFRRLGIELSHTLARSNKFLVSQTIYLTGGATRDRTADLLHAMQALSQLSYSPTDAGREGTGALP